MANGLKGKPANAEKARSGFHFARNQPLPTGLIYAVNGSWLKKRNKGMGRRPLKRLPLAMLGLVGVLLVLVWWPRMDELARWKAAMRARGDLLSLAELAPPFRPECLEQEMRFSNAIRRGNFFPARPGDIPLMARAQPGYARVVALQDEPVDRGAPLSWEDLAEQMEASAESLREIRALIDQWPEGTSRDFKAGPEAGFLSLIQKRRAAQVLVNAVVNDLHRREPQAALTNLQALLGLARLHGREGLLVDQMVRVAIGGLAVAATWEALQAPGWDDAALARLQGDLERSAMLPNMPRTVAMEQAYAMASYEAARTNVRGPQALVGSIGLSGNGRFVQAFNEAVYTPIWQSAWSREDELIYLKASHAVGEAVRQAQTNRSFQALRQLLAARRAEMDNHQGRFDKFRYQVAEAAQVNWEKACLTLMRTESMREMAIVAVALKRHQLRQGALPENLGSLEPQFLQRPAIDCMNGHSLLYQREADGGFTLHSVGENGQDEQGQGDDLIWPKPAPGPGP